MKVSILAVVLCVAAWAARDRAVTGATGARQRVRRARLDAEHQPHRHLRGAEARLLPRRGHRSEDPALREHRARDARQPRQGRLRLLLLGRRGVRARRRRRRDVGVRRAPAHRARDRLPRRPHRHQDAQGPRRQDLRGLRHARREAAAPDRDPPRRRQGRRSRTSRSTPPPTTPSTAGKADFTLPLATWEGIQAKLVGKPLKTFKLARYGVPPEYSALIASSSKYLARTRMSRAASWPPPRAATSTPPTIRATASRILIAANKQVLTQPQLVYESADLMAKSYYKDRAGNVGTQTLGVWKGYVASSSRPACSRTRTARSSRRRPTTRRTSRTRTCRARADGHGAQPRARDPAAAPDRRRRWSRPGSSTRAAAGSATTCCPRPRRVLSVAWDNRADLWANTLPTLRATLLGFALSLAVGFVLAVLIDTSAPLAARADARARGDADAPDRRDRAADDHLVRLRPHAQGAAGRARDVLPDHGGVRRGLRGQRARGRGAAALDGREPGAHLPLDPLPDLAAVLLRRPAHRDHLRRRRRDLRGVRRRERGPRHLHAEREELVPHRPRAGRRRSSAPCSRSPCSR